MPDASEGFLEGLLDISMGEDAHNLSIPKLRFRSWVLGRWILP